MQASILPKRADHEAQKLGFLPLTSVAAFFEQHSAGCGVAGRYSAARAAAGRLGDDRAVAGRCPAERHVSGRHSSTSSVIGQLSDAHGVIGRLSDIPGAQNVHLSPDNESRVQISPKIPGSIRVSPGCAGAPNSTPLGNAGIPSPPSSDTPSGISRSPLMPGIQPLQQKTRNIIPVFVLCNADSVIGCFSSISGYLSGQFTYNAPLNEKTRKRSV